VNGYYEKRAKLQAENSPLLKNPYKRDGSFIEEFEKAFVIAKLGDYAVAIHTGPVGGGIFGWGGGELCAFWTPKTGSVMLGRRRGWARQTGKPELSDSFEIWRTWPVHAVSGITAEGQVFSSGRIRNPNPVYTIKDRRAEAHVRGLIPKDATNTKDPCLKGDVQYERTFVADESGLTVTTSIQSDGKDLATELYETIPVFLRDNSQPEKNMSRIFFQLGDQWKDGTPELQENVKAVKIERYTGAVLITFKVPARLKLSPEVWADHYQSGANCRTILVDLLGSEGRPKAIPETSVSYKITVVKE
jgi:hypothetical protein